MANRKPILDWPRRGEIYLVNFDPAFGAEIKKTRPAIVIQNDVANHWSPITIVAAITSDDGSQKYPTEVAIQPPEGGLKKLSIVCLDQIRSVDKQKLIHRLGKVGDQTMAAINQALIISLGLIEL